MRAIAFVDLDDTLFQTVGKCPADLPPARLTPLGFARDGQPLSYATPRQLQFLRWLTETTRLIPVTARSLEALRRVDVPFTAAICAHGGVILDEGGAVDAAWASEIAEHAACHVAMLDRFAAAIRAVAEARSAAITVRVLHEAAVPIYVIAKHGAGDAALLHAVVKAAVPLLPAGWQRHLNGNNAALLPPFLGKRHAVARLLPGLRERFPDAPVIGIGDSLSDGPFMALCDYAMLPTGSQIAHGVLGRG